MHYTRLTGRPAPDPDGSIPVVHEFARDADAVAAARRLADTLLHTASDELRGRARQVITELVTNSVRHGAGRVVVRAWANNGSVDFEVRDEGDGFQVSPRAPGHDEASGWGLMIVDMLASAWGAGGRGHPVVWAHIEPRAMQADLARDPELEARVRDLLDVRMLIESVKDYGIAALDGQGRVTLWNAGAERLTGHAADDLLGTPIAALWQEAGLEGDLATSLAYGRSEHSGWMQRRDGSSFWADAVLTPVLGSGGRPRGFAVVFQDLTWRKRLDEDRAGLLERIRRLARTDDLTGLANRRAWHEELDRELARARRYGSRACIAMVDLDRFKEVNDSAGHVAGDELLKQAAAAWSRALRETDLLARYGGDEFSVILPDCDAPEAEVVIQRMRAATPPQVGCSVGIASSDGTEPSEAIVRRADSGLYAAKRAGGNRTVAV